MQESGTSYYGEVMELSGDQFYRLRFTYDQINRPLLRFPDVVTINGRDVVRSTAKAEPIKRYLEEYDCSDRIPPENIISETLGILEEIGAVTDSTGNGYGVQSFTEQDDEAIQSAITYRRCVEEDPEIRDRPPAEVVEEHNPRPQRTASLEEQSTGMPHKTGFQRR